ncbi:WG repeat-containing protein [Sphingobacterium faecale]|uniref:WG repeat-containing protein n=1 Tax=Sphingobacterium faecale TaxID=2803775 RepID=A0ABS1QZG9_9SPHI|nr:WG repeat-containing protein [Sphingobacterium faecale]MBL1407595.1 WG repeat-containing protein [Sphingobacterium faecale]
MKKFTLTLFMVLLLCTSIWAQSQKSFRIDYRVITDAGSTTENNESLIKAWVNKSHFRVDNAMMGSIIYVGNKDENSAFALLPDSEEYVIIADGSQDDEEEYVLPVELVAGKQKKIAGYNCKLATVKVDYGTGEDESTTIEIWYTEDIPNLYWGEFSFFKQLKGAVLSLKLGNYAFKATNVVSENVDNSFYEIPDNYTEMEDEGMNGMNEQLTEDRFVYADEEGVLYGMRDGEGNAITQPLYTYISAFTEDNVSVVIDDKEKYGAIDKDGKLLVPCKYDYLSYDEGTQQYLFGQGEKYGLLHKDGKIYVPAKYDMISFFNQGYATITLNDKSGLIDQNQKIVVPVQYDVIFEYNKHNFTTIEDEKYVLNSIAQKKKVVGGFDFLSLSLDCNVILAQKDGKYGYIDENGKTVIPFKFTFANTFSDDMAAVAEDEETEDIYYINTKGQRIDVAQN